jgi:hypothetical protein
MSYSQHVIFAVTYKWTQYHSVLIPGKTFRPSLIQHSSFLVFFKSYKENKVLWIIYKRY